MDINNKEYNYLYEDCMLIIFRKIEEVTEIVHQEYISELELVEDSILELQEHCVLPCCPISRIYN